MAANQAFMQAERERQMASMKALIAPMKER
ncbi:hypothetical protein H4V95_001182 [Arthrobacter sp. CAN_C5]|nr:hypothetical protein [Arthrobacter sp. CAN_C5]